MSWGWDLVHLKWKYLMNTWEHSLSVIISFLTKMAFRGFCIRPLHIYILIICNYYVSFYINIGLDYNIQMKLDEKKFTQLYIHLP